MKRILILTHVAALFLGMIGGALGTVGLLDLLLREEMRTTWRSHPDQVEPPRDE